MNTISGAKIFGTTKIFGTLAHPTAHVRAPMRFNALFAERGLDHVMIPIDVAPDGLAKTIEGLRATQNFIGAAVTIPHKMPLAEMCDELGLAAKVAGAVNAIRFDDDRRLIGDNFDGQGFVAGLHGEGHSLAGQRILLVGAGGASRAIAVALTEQKIAEPIAALDIANRTMARAEELADMVQQATGFASVRAVSLKSDLGECDKSEYDIIINATPLGLYGSDPMPFSLEKLRPRALICDIIMTPEKTELLDAAEKSGFRVHYGRHMLDYQMALIGKFIGALPS